MKLLAKERWKTLFEMGCTKLRTPCSPSPQPVGRPRKAVPLPAPTGPKLICSSSPPPNSFSCKQPQKGRQRQGGQRERLRHKEDAAEGASKGKARGSGRARARGGGSGKGRACEPMGVSSEETTESSKKA
eukprot:1148293-Pelagomonas_calceolata.AAC.3